MNKTKRTKAEQQELLEYLREKYEYMPSTGLLRYKGHDKPPKPEKRQKKGYLDLHIRWKGNMTHVTFHRAVWAVCKGEWPKGTIDHINNNVDDNRIENLRECSMSENRFNMVLPWTPNNDTGLPGVFLDNRKYRTRIAGKRFRFGSPYEAFYHATLCGKMYANDKH